MCGIRKATAHTHIRFVNLELGLASYQFDYNRIDIGNVVNSSEIRGMCNTEHSGHTNGLKVTPLARHGHLVHDFLRLKISAQ